MFATVLLTSPTAPATPTVPATVPAWVAVSGTVSAIITATGVLVAGGFAYFKFVKGRTFHPRCFIDMDCQPVEAAEGRMLRVSVTLRNDGQTALLFLTEAQKVLTIGEMDRTLWRETCESRAPVQWEDVEPILWGLDVSEGQLLGPPKETQKQAWWRWLTRGWLLQYLAGDKLEPGEQWARSTLVPVASGSVAFLLRVEVSACRHVAARHAARHVFYCRRACKKGTPPITWEREVHVLPGVRKKWSLVRR
jgi:hypothetical protein